MSTRPRRSAAQRATVAITDMADRDRDPSEQRTMSSRSSRRSGNGIASVMRGPPTSSPASSAGDGNQHIHLTVKLPSSKLRQATSSGNGVAKRRPSGGVTAAGGNKGRSSTGPPSKRSRGGKKSYVIESSEEEEEEEEEDEEDEDEEEEEEDEEDEDEDEEEEVEEDEIEVGTRAGFAKVDEEEEDDDEQMEDAGEEDAEGDDDGDEMDVEAEGDEMDVEAEGDDDEHTDADADGDVDMDVTPAPRTPAIKISKPPRGTVTPAGRAKSASSAKTTAKGTAVTKNTARDDDEDEDDEDEELSELESEPQEVNEAVEVANGEEDAEGEEEEDMDAEGEEEIEVADEDAEGEEDEELDSDEEGISRPDTPDLSKLTARQRAKLGDISHEYMKLSDEVQAKKHFTAEELSMRRAEMARRRRNLSEKRTEEVKMETINKLLKKQAPKTTRKNAAFLAAGDETPDAEPQRADPMLIRWVNDKEGSRVAVPDELLATPAGQMFMGGGAGGLRRGKMVEEVS